MRPKNLSGAVAIMKIQIQQLSQHLTEKTAPIYLISGDEFLLVQEACDTVRQHAITTGYSERETFYIEPGFSWESFITSTSNLSLFSERSLIELHLKSKLTDTGSKILQNYAKKPTSDKIVLIIADKLDASQQKTAWFKAIDTYGVVIPIWPIDFSQLPLWINKRLQQTGLKTDGHGIKLLADHAAGNLLAAAQEIEKLRLLYGSGNLTANQIITVITDNARFNVFNLLDTALAGKTGLLIRMLDNLKAEGTEPTIILWAIARELRSLVNMSFAIKKGSSLDQVMTQNNVWSTRKALTKQALLRHNLTSLQNLLKHAAHIDCIIKGADNQRLLWHELYKVYIQFAQTTTNKNSIPIITKQQ
ncbi:MAG: DNA polymerase III subunit delta [uncultured bacterium]|nr:MAG: DNA polymerase III subunit delta [uncultured bacterium]